MQIQRLEFGALVALLSLADVGAEPGVAPETSDLRGVVLGGGDDDCAVEAAGEVHPDVVWDAPSYFMGPEEVLEFNNDD